jgi:hypothetical protein
MRIEVTVTLLNGQVIPYGACTDVQVSATHLSFLMMGGLLQEYRLSQLKHISLTPVPDATS